MTFFPSVFGEFGFCGFGPYAASQLPAIDTRPAPSPDAPVKENDPLDRLSFQSFGAMSGLPGFDQAPPESLWTWWQMRRYSTIVLAHTITTAPALASTQSIEINGDSEDAELQKRKELAEGILLPVLNEVLAAAMEALFFGHYLQEVLWKRVDGLMNPVRFSPLLPGEAILYQDKSRQFTGFQVGQDYRDSRYGFLAVNNPWIDPVFGESRLRACREEWWRIRQSNLNADKMERKAAGIQMKVGIPMGLSFVDSDGKPLLAKDVAQTITDNAAQGQTFVVPLTPFRLEDIKNNPELAKIDMVKTEAFDWGDIGPSIEAHLSRISKLDVDIMRAWHRPEREAMEGNHGTKAEAGAHGAIGTTDTEQMSGRFIRQFNQQVTDRWLIDNWGPKARGTLYVKAAPLSDPQQEFLQEVVKSLIVDTATGPTIQAHIDKRMVLDRTEVPMVSQDDAEKIIADQQQAKDEAAKAQQDAIKAAPANGNGNGKMQIAASAGGNHRRSLLSRLMIDETDEMESPKP